MPRKRSISWIGNYSAGVGGVRQGGRIGRPANTLCRASMTRIPFLRMVPI